MIKYLIFVLFLFTFQVNAKVELKDTDAIYISRDIFSKDADKINDFNNMEINYVFLNSNGGSFHSAVYIANNILDNHPNAKVMITDRCASACTIIFFLMPLENRFMYKNSSIELHNVSYDFQKTRSVNVKVLRPLTQEVAKTASFITVLYKNAKIPDTTIISAMGRFHEDTLEIKPKELLSWGSINKIVE